PLLLPCSPIIEPSGIGLVSPAVRTVGRNALGRRSASILQFDVSLGMLKISPALLSPVTVRRRVPSVLIYHHSLRRSRSSSPSNMTPRSTRHSSIGNSALVSNV